MLQCMLGSHNPLKFQLFAHYKMICSDNCFTIWVNILENSIGLTSVFYVQYLLHITQVIQIY